MGEAERIFRPLASVTEIARPQLMEFAASGRQANQAETMPHIVEHLLLGGDMSGLTAKKGIGKSTLLRSLALAVSEGNDFLGLPTNQTRVWYLDLEPGSHQQRHKAFADLGWSESNRNLVLTASSPVAGQTWAYRWLEDNIVKEGFGLVIIDTLMKFCKIEQGNDYASGVYGAVPLEAIIKRTGCHILVAHHSPKNSAVTPNTSAADLFLGSVGIAGSLGVCMAMRRQRGGSGDPRISLFMDAPRYARQVIEGEWLLAKDPLTNRITLGETVRKDWWTRAQADVMGAARGMGAIFTIGELVGDLEDYKKAEVARIVRYLVKHGQLEDAGKEARRGGAARYRIAGQTWLNPAPVDGRDN
jgi:hypothetical protein